MLAAELSAGAWVVAAAGTLALGVLLAGQRSAGRGRTRMLLLAAVLAQIGVAGLVVENQAQDRRVEQDAQASAMRRAQMLPTSPERAARTLVQAIGDGDGDGDGDGSACTLLITPAAAGELAVATRTPNCPVAIHALSTRVLDPRRYARPDTDAVPTTITATDACQMTWNGAAAVFGTAAAMPAPGPQVGRLDLVRLLGQGYQVTRIRPC